MGMLLLGMVVYAVEVLQHISVILKWLVYNTMETSIDSLAVV